MRLAQRDLQLEGVVLPYLLHVHHHSLAYEQKLALVERLRAVLHVA